jgi:hypothetical protein
MRNESTGLRPRLDGHLGSDAADGRGGIKDLLIATLLAAPIWVLLVLAVLALAAS